MQGFVTALTGENGLTAATFFGQLTALAPLVVILVPIAFGYRALRRSIKGASNAKARI